MDITKIAFIIPIIVAFLAYHFGQRSTKITRFYTQAEANLTELCGPIHFQIEKIMNHSNPKDREDELDDLYNRFSSNKSPLHKLANLRLVELFSKSERSYIAFKKSRDEDDWSLFWKDFQPLQEMIQHEYWANFSVVYNEYKWYQKSLNSNYLVRVVYDLIKWFKQTVNFLMIVSLLAIYTTTFDYFFVKEFPKGSVQLSLIFSIFTLILFGLSIMISAPIYHIDGQKRSSGVRRFAERFFPRLINIYDDFPIRKNKIEIPKMFNKKHPLE